MKNPFRRRDNKPVGVQVETKPLDDVVLSDLFKQMSGMPTRNTIPTPRSLPSIEERVKFIQGEDGRWETKWKDPESFFPVPVYPTMSLLRAGIISKSMALELLNGL